MASGWPALPYEEWRATRDTLHAHTQVLGKLAARAGASRAAASARRAAPHRAGLGDAPAAGARRLGRARRRAGPARPRGRSPSTATDGSRASRSTPDRPVGVVTREVLAAVRELGGPVEIDPTPQETPWTTPLDEDDEHATYDPAQVERTSRLRRAPRSVLAALRAPYRGRSTPVNAWWGTFDLAVGLFSGRPAEPPREDFITRNSMDAEQVAVGWWPGDARYPRAAFFAYAHPAPEGFASATLSPAAARWDDDARRVRPRLGRHPRRGRSARGRARLRPLGGSARVRGVRLGRLALAASVEGSPPPVV